MIRRSRRILSLVDEGLERGVESEDRVEEALKLLVNKGEIHHFERSWPDGELDISGIDFLVYPENMGWAIMLQVKSSESGRIKHQKKYDDIPAVVVDRRLGTNELSELILKELGLYKADLDELLDSLTGE